MSNFETLIGQALAAGTSPDVLAKQMTEAFNTALKQKQEAEAKTKAASAREKLINEIEQSFWHNVKEETLSGADAAALAWLIAVKDSEYGKSIEDPAVLKDFFDHILNIFSHAEDSFKIKRGLKDAFGDISEIFDFGQMFQIDKSDKIRGGPDRKCECSSSDKDVIQRFLDSLK